MAAKQNESRDSERYVLTGKMYYNNLHPQYPDTAYTPRWGMALSIDSDQQSLASTHEMTIKPPTDIMSNPFINLHKNVKRMGGEDNEAPSVVDAKKNPVAGDEAPPVEASTDDPDEDLPF